MKTSINSVLSSILLRQVALIAAEQNSSSCNAEKIAELARGLIELGLGIQQLKDSELASVSQEQLDIQLAQFELMFDHQEQKP